MSKLAKTARNALIADAALAFARDRIAARLPGVEPRKTHRGRRALLIGGAVAVGAVLLVKRQKVAALLPGRADEPAPPPPPAGRGGGAGAAAPAARPGDAAHLQLRRAGAGGEHRHGGAHTAALSAT